MYKYLDAQQTAANPEDLLPYTGPKFSATMQQNVDPFADKYTKIPDMRKGIAKNYNILAGDYLGDYPDWLKNVPLDNPVNAAYIQRIRTPEFDHIFDVMSEDLQRGILTPRQLETGSYSVEAAARRAAEYNAEKIKNMEKARAIEAKGFPALKEYDSGHKWLELKHNTDPEATRRALTNEGDTMGHCVGGYCNTVLRGDTRIVSLRDPKGQPRVTIELRKDSSADGQWAVHQVKGKANRKPTAADIPLVQDYLLNSPDISGVRYDLGNTDLIDSRERIPILRNMVEDMDNPNGTEASFVNWADEYTANSGKPYIPKAEIKAKLDELYGDPEHPIYGLFNLE